MEFNFSTGVVIGIVIAVIGFNIMGSDDKTQSAPSKSSYSSSRAYNNSYSGYRDYDDSNYESYGLHERGFH